MRRELTAMRQPFETVFRWLILSTALWSFTALAATGQFPPTFAIVGYALFWTAWVGEKRFPLPRIAWWCVIGLFVIIDWAVWIRIGRIDAIVCFLVFLLVNKLWTPKKTRDILQILLIAFFFMLTASIMTTRLVFVVFFVGYLFLLFLSLVFYTVRREHDMLSALGAGIHAGVNPHVIVPREFYARAWGGAFLILLIAVAVFALFPRLSPHNMFTEISGVGLRRTGFTGGIRLNAIGDIEENYEDVMRVIVSGEDGNRPAWMDGIYMRGAVADTYRLPAGVSSRLDEWHRDAASDEILYPRVSSVRMDNREIAMQAPPRVRVRQKVFLNPGYGRTFFAAEAVERFTLPRNRQIHTVHDTTANTLRRLDRVAEILSYDAISAVWPPSLGDPDEAITRVGLQTTLPALRNPERYTTMPETPRGAEVAGLAERIASEAGAQTRFEQVQAIAGFLRSNFAYATTNLNTGGLCPTEDFLLDVRRGHCEFFASGMVFLLRSLEIPSRIAMGYYTDRWNDHGGYFRITQADAHAWVEVFYETAGWVPIDPTPPSFLERHGGLPGMRGQVADWIDSMRMQWLLYVVDYDLNEQRNLYRFVGGAMRNMAPLLERLSFDGSRLFSQATLRHASGSAVPAFIIGVVVFLGLFGTLTFGAWTLRAGRKRGDARRRRELTRRGLLLYERILAMLARRGLRKPPADTAREHARRVESARPDLIGFIQLTERYYAARFAGAEFSEDDEADLHMFLQRARIRPPRRIESLPRGSEGA